MMVGRRNRLRLVPKKLNKKHALAVWIATLGASVLASAQPGAIDSAQSTMTVHVYKAGVFSVLGHDHEIAAPINRGSVDSTAHTVELEVKAGALQVRDKGISEKDRTQIQSTMLGPEVLNAERYPEITFQSTDVQSAGPNSWTMRGDLTLHGESQAISVRVQQINGHYIGSSRFKQTRFGIQPVRVAGGTIQVKDEVQVEFNIQAGR